MNIIEGVSKVTQNIRRRLKDPNFQESQAGPSDFIDPPSKEQAEREEATVKYVMSSFKSAAESRRPVERDWVLSVGMEEGRQWLGWDDATHRCINLLDEDEKHRYITDPLIRPLLLKWLALVTMTKPDASSAPDTDSDMDRAAAREAGAILGHLDRICKAQMLAIKRARWAAICGIGWEKLYWDDDAEAQVPIFGPNGSDIVKKVSLPVGEVCREVPSPFEIFLEPVSSWEKVGYLIQATVRPLDYFQRYGERGMAVEGDSDDPIMGYVDAYMEGTTGGNGFFKSLFSGKKDRHHAVEYQMWVKPTLLYPEGRYIIVADGLLLYDDELPYPKLRGGAWCPFVRTVYQEAAWHPYGHGLVQDLAPLQVLYNRLISRILERIEDDRLTLLIEKRSGLGADAYELDNSDRNIRKIFYNVDKQPPGYQQTPQVIGDVYRLRDIAWGDMQHIAGIHDVEMGGAPPGVTAGISIELLQQSDKTQMGLFLQGLEQSAVEIAEWEIALYGKFASPYLPRLMGLDRTGNAQTAMYSAQAFTALTNGGSCSVIVTPGSATPKTSAGENQEILEFLKAGLFDPANPGAEIAVRLMTLSRSDEILTLFQEFRKQAQANQPSPAQIEAIKQQGAIQQQKQALEADAAHQAVRADADIRVEQAKTTLQMQQDQAQHQRDLEKTLVGHVYDAAANPLVARARQPMGPASLSRFKAPRTFTKN